jgi:hypothetical protein
MRVLIVLRIDRSAIAPEHSRNAAIHAADKIAIRFQIISQSRAVEAALQGRKLKDSSQKECN